MATKEDMINQIVGFAQSMRTANLTDVVEVYDRIFHPERLLDKILARINR